MGHLLDYAGLRTDHNLRRRRTDLTGKSRVAVRVAVRIAVCREVEADGKPCGYKFPPVHDPQRFPVCPRCKELAALLWGPE